MSRDRDGCNRRAISNALRKIKRLVARIVVIGELSRGPLYLDTIQIACRDQSLRSHMAGQSAGGAYLTPFAIVMLHIPGGETHQRQGGKHKDQVEGIEEKHVLLPF